jgi:hypothetical protein
MNRWWRERGETFYGMKGQGTLNILDMAAGR